MKKLAKKLSLVAAAIAAFQVSVTAQAQTCFPPAIDVPGLPGAPEWKDFDDDGFWRPELDDPRWAGGIHHYLTALPSGGSPAWIDDVIVRGVAKDQVLYLAFLVQADDNGLNADDYVFVGLSKGALNNAIVLRVDGRSGGAVIGAPPAPAAPAELQADNPLPSELAVAGISRFETTDSTLGDGGWGVQNTGWPAWARGARWDRASLPGPRWAITLRLDLSAAGYNTGGDLRLFLGARINTSNGDVIVGNVTPAVDDAVNVGDTNVPVLSTSWGEARELGTPCGGPGLAAAGIGVWNGSNLTQEIHACGRATSCETPGTLANTFRVTVANLSGEPPYEHGLRARIRIADWGSSVANRRHAPWHSMAGLSSTIFTDPQGDLLADPSWSWSSVQADGQALIDYTCSIMDGDGYCPKLYNPEEFAEQCLLIEIAPTHDFQGLSFSSAAMVTCDLTFLGLNDPGSGGAGGADGSAEGGAAGQQGSAGSAGEGGAPSAEGGASSEAGAGAMPSDGGFTSGGASSPDGNRTEKEDDGGCGCRTVGRERSDIARLFAPLLAAAVFRFRRRGRRWSSR